MSPHLLAAALSLLPAKRHHEAPAIVDVLERNAHAIDPFTLLAWGWRESRWDARAVGKHGERGVLQVGQRALIDLRKRFTHWKGARLAQLVQLDIGVAAGLDYLELMRKRLHSPSLERALKHYNSGSPDYYQHIQNLADDLRSKFGGEP